MQQLPNLRLTVTYYRSPDSMSAALATLDILSEQNGPERLNQLGQRLINGIDQAAAHWSVPVKAVGYPATPFIEFEYSKSKLNERATWLFMNTMLRNGVLVHPGHHWFLCTSMTVDDIDFALEQIHLAFGVIADRIPDD